MPTCKHRAQLCAVEELCADEGLHRGSTGQPGSSDVDDTFPEATLSQQPEQSSAGPTLFGSPPLLCLLGDSVSQQSAVDRNISAPSNLTPGL